MLLDEILTPISCFFQDCGVQLTDEPDKRCYPLQEHLLCHSCHIQRIVEMGCHPPSEIKVCIQISLLLFRQEAKACCKVDNNIRIIKLIVFIYCPDLKFTKQSFNLSFLMFGIYERFSKCSGDNLSLITPIRRQ